ncbi:hypothetical protein [Nocardia sp. bgisy134]|uniref:hypothetical protein n=1 Tax=Nocardia sp. bgisy134 TaxID=3413789 RepID=UPI003D74705E
MTTPSPVPGPALDPAGPAPTPPKRGRAVALGFLLGMVLCLVVVGAFFLGARTSDEPAGAAGTTTSTARTTTAPPTTTTPDPLAGMAIGECAALQSPGAPGTPARPIARPEKVPCESLGSVYRLVQYGPCTEPRVSVQQTQRDSTGRLVYHYCFAYDWQAGTCYDASDWSEPLRVDCGTPGSIMVTAVFHEITPVQNCPLDENGASARTWDKRNLTLCMRGSDGAGN